MHRIKRVGYTLFTQAACVVMGAISGLIVVRTMEKEIYGEYAYLQTLIALGVGLANFGNIGAFLGMIGDRGRDEAYVRDAAAGIWRLNKVFVAIAYAAIAVYWLVITFSKGWLSLDYLLASATVCVMIYSQIVRNFTYSVFRVRGELRWLGIVDVSFEALRLTGFLLIKQLGMHEVMALYMASNLGSSLLANYILRKSGRDLQWWGVKDVRDWIVGSRERFWGFVRPLLFAGYFFQVQGVVSFGLIALLAPVATIAEVSAMGRLIMLMAPLDKVLDIMLYPKLASISNFKRFERLLFLAVFGWLGFCVVVVASSIIAPGVWIWILGSKYSNIAPILPWVVGAAVVERVAGLYMWSMMGRGMAKHQTQIALAGLGVQIVYLMIFPINDTLHAVWFNCWRVAGTVVAQIISYMIARRIPLANVA